MKGIEKYDVSQATHLLICEHCVGLNCKTYYMKCIVLGKTRSGSTKVIVFGDRYWKDREHVKRLRYVQGRRLIELNKTTNRSIG